MAYITPPVFVDNDATLAADIQILLDDLSYFNGAAPPVLIEEETIIEAQTSTYAAPVFDCRLI